MAGFKSTENILKKIIPVHVTSISTFTTNSPFDASSQGSEDLSGVIVFALSAKYTVKIKTSMIIYVFITFSYICIYIIYLQNNLSNPYI